MVERRTPEREFGRGVETYLRRVLSLSKTLYSPKVLVIPGKRWLRPDMTKKLLTRTLSLNTKPKKNLQEPSCRSNIKFNYCIMFHTASRLGEGNENASMLSILLHVISNLKTATTVAEWVRLLNFSARFSHIPLLKRSKNPKICCLCANSIPHC